MHFIQVILTLSTILFVNHVTCSLRRIFNGREDIFQKFPFIVLIDKAVTNSSGMNCSEPICSGSLLSEVWVITAASCIQEDIRVRYGSAVRCTAARSSDTVYTKIISVVRHPGALTLDFSNNNNRLSKKMIYKNNIALINIEGVRYRQSVKLLATDYQSLFGLPVTTVAFSGETRRSRGGRSRGRRYRGGNFALESIGYYLRSLERGHAVVIKCEEIEGDINPAMCVGKKCGEGREVPANPSDHGGPMLYGDKLIGVGSFVYKFTSGYTPVSPYLEWIHDVVSNNSNRSTEASVKDLTK